MHYATETILRRRRRYMSQHLDLAITSMSPGRIGVLSTCLSDLYQGCGCASLIPPLGGGRRQEVAASMILLPIALTALDN